MMRTVLVPLNLYPTTTNRSIVPCSVEAAAAAAAAAAVAEAAAEAEAAGEAEAVPAATEPAAVAVQ
jgi:hypothetical protein